MAHPGDIDTGARHTGEHSIMWLPLMYTLNLNISLIAQLSLLCSRTAIQLLSSAQIFVTPWTEAHQVLLSSTASWSLLKFMSMSQWCHPTISFSATTFFLCLLSFPISESFPISQLFTSGGQSSGASASVLPMNIQDWFPLDVNGFISLQSKGLSRVFSSTTVQKHQFFSTQPSLYSNSHIHTWLLPLTVQALSVKWCPCYLILSRYVTASLPRSKCLLISWLQSPSEVILEPKKIKSVTASTFSPCYLPWSDGTRCHNLSFLKVEFQASFFILFQPQEDL